MGQALRRLRSPTGVSAARPSPPPQATHSNSPHVEAPAVVASQASKAPLRQSVEVKPQAPEPRKFSLSSQQSMESTPYL